MKKLCAFALLVAVSPMIHGGPPAKGPAPHAAKSAAAASPARAVDAVPYFRFENFTIANGLPDNHVFSVLVDGDRIWAGTENWLAVLENNTWRTYTTTD